MIGRAYAGSLLRVLRRRATVRARPEEWDDQCGNAGGADPLAASPV